jgi:ribosomal protein L13E
MSSRKEKAHSPSEVPLTTNRGINRVKYGVTEAELEEYKRIGNAYTVEELREVRRSTRKATYGYG